MSKNLKLLHIISIILLIFSSVVPNSAFAATDSTTLDTTEETNTDSNTTDSTSDEDGTTENTNGGQSSSLDSDYSADNSDTANEGSSDTSDVTESESDTTEENVDGTTTVEENQTTDSDNTEASTNDDQITDGTTDETNGESSTLQTGGEPETEDTTETDEQTDSGTTTTDDTDTSTPTDTDSSIDTTDSGEQTNDESGTDTTDSGEPLDNEPTDSTDTGEQNDSEPTSSTDTTETGEQTDTGSATTDSTETEGQTDGVSGTTDTTDTGDQTDSDLTTDSTETGEQVTDGETNVSDTDRTDDQTDVNRSTDENTSGEAPLPSEDEGTVNQSEDTVEGDLEGETTEDASMMSTMETMNVETEEISLAFAPGQEGVLAEFTTGSGDYSAPLEVVLYVHGNLLNGVSEEPGHLLKQYNLILENKKTGDLIVFEEADAYFSGNAPILNLQFSLGSDISLEPDTTYLIKIDSGSEALGIMNKVLENIYLSNPDQNVELRIDRSADSVFGFATFENPDITETSQPTIRELPASSVITLLGNNKVQINLGDTSNFEEIHELKLVVEDSVDTMNPTDATAFVDGQEVTVNTNFESNSTFNKLSISMNGSAALNSTDQLLEIEATDDGFTRLIDNAANAHRHASVYLLAYDSTGQLIGYQVFDGTETVNIVDPAFDLLYSQNEPVFGYLNKEDNGYGHKNFFFQLENTGITNLERLAINGETKTEDGDVIPFILTAFRQSGGEFEGNFYFISPDDIDYVPVPVDFDKETYEQADQIEKDYSQIPIKPGQKNTVTLSYTFSDGQTVKTTFDYYPVLAKEVISSGSLRTYKLSELTEMIQVNVNKWGALPDYVELSLHVLEDNMVGQEVARFDTVASIEHYTEEVDVGNGEIGTQGGAILTFVQGSDALNQLDQLAEGTMLVGKLHYFKEYEYTNSSGELLQHTVDITQSLYSESIIDRSPLAYGIDFVGEYEENDTTYYEFKVHFSGDIDQSDISLDNFTFYTEDGQELSLDKAQMSLTPLEEGVINRTFILIMPKNFYQKGMQLQISGVKDVSGRSVDPNEMLELPVEAFLGYFLDHNGNKLSDKRIYYIHQNELPDVLNGEWDHISIGGMDTDESGILHHNIVPGNYMVLGYSNRTDDWITKHVMFELEIPVSTPDHPVDITLPADNVTGNVKRNDDYLLTEELVFMKPEYAALWKQVKQELEQTENDEQRKILHDKMHILETYFQIIVETRDDGTFTSFFPVGEYEFLGIKSGYDIEPADQTQRFTSPGEWNDIEVGARNAIVKLTDHNGNPISNSSVHIFGPNHLSKRLFTDEAGRSPVYLPEQGTYVIGIVESTGFTKGAGYFYYLDNQTFTFNLSEGVQEIPITLPPVNGHLEFYVNGDPLTEQDWIDLRLENNDESFSIWMFSDQGYIDVYLPPGEYQVTEYHTRDFDNDHANIPFTIGEKFADIAIELDPQYNAYVQLVDEQGNPLQGYSVHVKNKSGTWGRDGITGEDGKAYFTVPPYDIGEEGEEILIVESYSKDSEWKRLDGVQFIITSENNEQNKAGITVTVETPNFIGKILDENGNPVTDAYMDIRNTQTGEKQGYEVSETGEFAVTIDEPGEYEVYGVDTTEGKYYELSFRFKVIEQNGELIVTDLEGNPLSMPVTIKEGQNYNFFGHLYKDKDSKQLFKGEYLSFVVKQTDVDEETYNLFPWLYEQWIDVNVEDGSFKVYLDPRHTYEIIAISTDNDYYKLANPISVELSSDTPFIFEMPETNFYGTVFSYEDTDVSSVTGGGMWLERLNSEEGEPEGQWVEINSDGSFSKDLPEGTYVLRSVQYDVDGTDQRYYMRLNQEIVIGENSKNLLIQPNVKGIIHFGNLTVGNSESGDDYYGIDIFPVYTEEDFNGDTNAYRDYKINPWQYSIHAQMEKVVQNGQISMVFYTYLEPGDYNAKFVKLNDYHIEMDESFTIGDTISENVTKNGDRYTLTIDYSPNVEGAVLDTNGEPVPDAYVQIVKMTEDWEKDYSQEQYYLGAEADQNGMYRINLDPGNYRVEGYSTPGQWKGNKWIDGSFSPVRIDFTVDANGSVTFREGSITSFDILPNMTGTIYTSSGDESSISYRILTCLDENCDQIDYNDQGFWGHTMGESSHFQGYLPDGYYLFAEAGNSSEWFTVNQPFEVSNGQLVNGPLEIKEEEPNFVGTAYRNSEQTEPVQWGWIHIKPQEASENDWTRIMTISTEEDGTFKRVLKPGNYEVISFGDHTVWKQVSIPFTVNEDGSISSVVQGFVKDGDISIFPPSPNVTGSVIARNGGKLDGQSWIAIKPADASEYDWSEVIWVQVENGNFETYLKPGDYKVVEVSGMNDRYQTYQPFTVKTGEIVELIIEPPAPSVKGTAYQDEEGTAKVQEGWITIARFNQNGEQVTLDGTDIPADAYQDPYTGIYYGYTKSTIIENGWFSFILDSGTYRVIEVYHENGWYRTNEEFHVIENETATVTVTKPSPNVTIEIKNVPNEYLSQQPELLVTREADGVSYVQEIKLKTLSGNDFTFEANLLDGTYHIESFYGEGTLPIEETIEVTGSENNFVIDLSSNGKKQMTVGTVKVDGSSLSHGFNLDVRDQHGKKYVIHVKKDGTFKRPLPKDMQFEIVGIFDHRGYKSLTGVTFGTGSEAQGNITIDIPLSN